MGNDKQRGDAESPMAVKECLLVTDAVDTHEGCNMSIFDIPGSYLHTETYKDAIMLL